MLDKIVNMNTSTNHWKTFYEIGLTGSNRIKMTFKVVFYILNVKLWTTQYHYVFCTFLLFLMALSNSVVAGGMRGGKLARGRLYNSRIPVVIQHQNPTPTEETENINGAKIVQSSHFELDYMLGRKITFFCMAQGIPRPEITWFKDGIELYAHRYFQVHEWPLGNDTIKSKMEIDPTTQQDAGYYECQADNQHAIDRRGFRTDYEMITY